MPAPQGVRSTFRRYGPWGVSEPSVCEGLLPARGASTCRPVNDSAGSVEGAVAEAIGAACVAGAVAAAAGGVAGAVAGVDTIEVPAVPLVGGGAVRWLLKKIANANA